VDAVKLASRRFINNRTPSRPEIPEVLHMSWNCPEISNCPEILLIWSECPDMDLCYAVITAVYKSWLCLCCWRSVSSNVFSCDFLLFYV